MNFSKPGLSFQKQAELLISRGMIGEKSYIEKSLSNINYYKLSAYWRVFQQGSTENFKPNTEFKHIIERYKFDALLRNILMEVISTIETSLKTILANSLCLNIDPFFYTDPVNFPGLIKQKNHKQPKDRFQELQTKIEAEYNRSKETFVKHFKCKYGDSHDLPPAWIIIEVISFGSFITMFNNIPNSEGKKLARVYGVEYKVLKSWLWTMNEVRNICAHHSRLWNKELGNKPIIPKKGTLTAILGNIKNSRVFYVICIFLWLDSVNTQKSEWFKRLLNLIYANPNIPTSFMGFPADWESKFQTVINTRK